MFMWGLVIAKAKSGITASASKDHSVVKSSYSKTVVMAVLVGIAYVAKYNSDH